MEREDAEKLLKEHNSANWKMKEVYPLLRGHFEKQADSLKKRYNELKEQIISAMCDKEE